VAGASAQAPTVVRVSTLKLVGGAPIFWGIQQGYFTKEGIRVEPVYFGAAAPVATAVATGDTEVGATGITGTLFNLSAGGGKIWLVADRGQEYAGYHLNAMVVPKAAYDQGVRSLRDLRGKRIGITTLGSTYHYQIGELLERNKMGLGDVRLVPLRDFSLIVEALRTGQVDGAILSPPFGAESEQQGWGKILFWVGDQLRNQVTGVFYGQKLHDNHDLGVRFMKGYLRATRDYYDACLARPARGSCDAIVAVTARILDQPPAAVRDSLPYIDRNARLYTLDLQRQETWYLANGMIDRAVPLERFVDQSFIAEAVRQLGP
jgi:NitT/TauT family transport system substrate-binding protein